VHIANAASATAAMAECVPWMVCFRMAHVSGVEMLIHNPEQPTSKWRSLAVSRGCR